ncbi:MAG: hypothetical protein MH252_14130 [Thermosynechococcaceae cyanobacterium MS004]|nr:hypothetical protein [Thermosynechococcaceae cyanobacterium MS004]
MPRLLYSKAFRYFEFSAPLRPQVSEPQEPNQKEQAEAIQPEVAPASPPHSSSTVTPEQVESWSRIAQALAKPDDYQARVEQVTAAYRAGEPLSSNAEAALHQVLSQFQNTLNSVKDWYRLSRDAGAPEHYLEKIQRVGVNLQNGQPMSENARTAMQTDFRRADWMKLNQGVSESTPERHTARVALRALQQGKRPEEVLKILEFDPSYRQLHAHQGQASAQAYAQNAIAFAMKYHNAPQSAVSQSSPHMGQGRRMMR